MPDLIIIGAGPAGVSAAIEARTHGLSVLLLDENAAPGGRIWQALESRGAGDADEAAALDTLRAFRGCGADASWRAAVWAIEPDGTVFWTQDEPALASNADTPQSPTSLNEARSITVRQTTHTATASHVLLATGTTERPLPIPGWTLPGVMTVGAAQIALKTAGLVPAGDTWLAGQGPLLLRYAEQALRAGGRIAGILDLSDGLAPVRALRHLPTALRSGGDILQGLAWRRAIAQAGVPWISATDLRAEGDGTLCRVTFRAGGRVRSEQADLLMLHDGVIPSVHLTRALGCTHDWDPAQQCWAPVTDSWGVSSLPNVLIAGDGAGIGGAPAAALSGRLAALHVAHACGRIDQPTRDSAAAPLRAARARRRAVRPLIDALYAPLKPNLDDATIVCRCEEVTAGQVREAVRQGCIGLNQLKAFTRCGMGPCQGRMCGSVAASVLAEARGVPLRDVAPYRLRFPTRPVTIGALASLRPADQADAVGV